jgi:hypothetical protein
VLSSWAAFLSSIILVNRYVFDSELTGGYQPVMPLPKLVLVVSHGSKPQERGYHSPVFGRLTLCWQEGLATGCKHSLYLLLRAAVSHSLQISAHFRTNGEGLRPPVS